MTDEAGGGVPSGELRERLTSLIERGHVNALHGSDAILAEIAAAGFELVPTADVIRREDVWRYCNCTEGDE